MTDNAIEKHRAFIASCAENLHTKECLDYIESRGIDVTTAEKYGIGYDVHDRRVVLPFRDPFGAWYAARDVTGTREEKDKIRYTPGDELGPRPLFNPTATDNPLFALAEGPFDALSLTLCGCPCAGIGSNRLSNAQKDDLAALSPRRVLIVADADRPGFEGAIATAEALTNMGHTCKVVSVPNAKDASELFAADRDKLEKFVAASVIDLARRELEERREVSDLKLRVSDPSDVAAGLFDLDDLTDPVPLGIDHLDKALGGGIPAEGLTAMAAMSSMGKTTFCVQAADTIAASGRPVLFVTIEQTAREVTAKSLARIMAKRGIARATYSDMLSYGKRAAWGTIEQSAFLDACEIYNETISPRLRVASMTGRPTAKDVSDAAARVADEMGQAPVVFVDYLQLMAPPDGMERSDARLSTDATITAFRQMTAENRAPVFLVSSIGRGNYSKGVTIGAFKESSGIEFGLDMALGLQASGVKDIARHADNPTQAARDIERRIDECRSNNIRRCEIVVMKNRAGEVAKNPVPVMLDAPAGLWYKPRVM